MENTAGWIERAQRVQLGNYAPAPIVLESGEGCRVVDVDGKRYLDLSGGIAVLSVGHAHPRLAKAIADQASRLMHVSNLFYNTRAIELAEALTSRTGFARAYFCNSGAEANEALLKLARRHHHNLGDGSRIELIATEKSFHGRTYGALSVTGQTKYHEGMGPLLGGVRTVPYGDLDAMRAVVGKSTAAVLVEPLQAEGGLVVPPAGYLRGLREMCDQAGALLLFDEVQTGYGRLGTFLGAEVSGVVPDACSLAKGIAGGFPLGAMIVGEKASAALPPGSHASTFGGNPLACAAALAVLEIIDAEGLVERARSLGEALAGKLDALVSEGSLPVRERRGLGLLQGLRLEESVDPVATFRRLIDEGLLVSLAGGDVVRFSPPLTVEQSDLDEGLHILRRVLEDAPRKSA
jgi:acetylornithine/N-succinyldiaminopimelate aminotransferase